MKQLEPIYRAFGVRVEYLRTALGLTQEELAKRVHLTRTSIANIEAGRQRLPLHDVETFARAFGVAPRNLLRGIWT